MADGYTPDAADVELAAQTLRRYCVYCGHLPGRRCGVHAQAAENVLSALAAADRLQTAALDAAMHSVWLHGNWRWLTTQMTTAEKEAAADAVDRHTATYPPDDCGEPVERWWRSVPVTDGHLSDPDLTRAPRGRTMNDADPMPMFAIKGRDRLGPRAIEAYLTACDDEGLEWQAEQVHEALAEITAWQQRNPELVKLPDHAHVPVTVASPHVFETTHEPVTPNARAFLGEPPCGKPGCPCGSSAEHREDGTQPWRE